MSKIKQETLDKIPQDWKDAIESLKERHNCPPELSLTVLFSVANFAAQAMYKVDPFHFGLKPLGENIMICLSASGGKSTVIEECAVGVDRFILKMISDADLQRDQYKVDLKLYEDSLKPDSKGNSNKLPKPNKPLSGEFRAQGSTLNGIIDILDGVPFLGIFNPDAASFLNNYSMRTPEMALELVSNLCKLFSGEIVTHRTKVDNITLMNRSISMCLMIQPEAADKFLNNEMFSSLGLHNRFLTVTVDDFETPDPIFSKDYLAKLKISKTKMEPFHNRIEKMLLSYEDIQEFNFMQDKVRRLQNPNGRPNNQLCLAPIEAEESTYPFLQGWTLKVKKMKNEEKYEDHKGYLQRAQEHLFKIAATLACYDGKSSININHFKCAAGLFEWFMDEKTEITPMTTNIYVNTAEKIIDLVKRKGGSMLESKVSDFSRAYRNMDPDQRAKVWAVIDDSDNCEVLFFRHEKTGKPTRQFKLVS